MNDQVHYQEAQLRKENLVEHLAARVQIIRVSAAQTVAMASNKQKMNQTPGLTPFPSFIPFTKTSTTLTKRQ